jgi:ketosteroid isomerase-like protein
VDVRAARFLERAPFDRDVLGVRVQVLAIGTPTLEATGDVAIVQYHYMVASENQKKERKRATGRYTDVLIKENGRWMFVAWAGGDDPEE